MKKFVVQNGKIVNIIKADDSFQLEGYSLHNAEGIHGNIGWDWVDGAPVEPLPTEDVAWKNLRSKRNRLLSESDWTQIPDAPVDQSAWAAYRQALRDLPENTTDPYNPIWPTPPA